MFQFPQVRAALFTLLLLLAGCGGRPPTPQPVACPPAQCPVCPAVQCPVCPKCPEAPHAAAPAVPSLQKVEWHELDGLAEDRILEALPALRQSCAKLGETEPWRAFCGGIAALGAAPGELALAELIQRELRPWKVVNPDASEEGLVTGYYEPLIKGSRTRSARARWPVFGVPDDLVSVDLAGLYPELGKLRLRGRIDGRSLKPYWSRGEIDALGTRLQAPVLLWAEDPIELFFMQVQGSGRVALPDGSRVRLGYADQNGHRYMSIGRWLIEQGELTLAQASLDGIRSWAQAHPARLTELLAANPSYVFFRELPPVEGGPPGALGVPLSAGRSVAIDPRTIPLGAPVFLATTMPGGGPPLRRLMAAQDTGGAITGAVRADFYWGFGAEAGRQAGRMRQQGRLWVLLPPALEPR